MHKGKKGRKFGRKRDQRAALIHGLARSLILHGKIRTSEAKAKEVRTHVEAYITKSKTNTLANRRSLERLFDSAIVKKLFSEIGPRYRSRPGGYTRIMKLAPRNIDSAKMAVIEFA
ncbi:MAG: 50S ribosomal protein L17 [Candidatus Spechtbacteria bacterium]|nr:50S ribosomal protein L17 [Candidatus Spechtbacteria bacterium]